MIYVYVLENMYVGFNCALGIICAGGKYHTNVSSADVVNDSREGVGNGMGGT